MYMDGSTTVPVPPLQPPSDPQASQSPATDTSELAHINQEMYKKSAELSARNKTLSLLQQISQIILSSITNPTEIAKQVTSLLANEDEFKIAAIYLYSDTHKILQLLAVSESVNTQTAASTLNFIHTYLALIPLSDTQNTQIQAITEKRTTSTEYLGNVIVKDDIKANTVELQRTIDVKSTLTLPLIVRSEIIGTMVISISEEKALSSYQQDLLVRLSEAVGIALDNALLYDKVQAANEKLKALDKLKDEFVSLASHELRTPMTAIKYYLWLFLNEEGTTLGEKQKVYLQNAYSSTNRLINLVNDMLNVSRIESGRFTVNAKPTNLPALVNDVVKELIPTAQKEGNQIAVVMPQQAVPEVLADSDRLHQVLVNLIGNAVKFTPSGGRITITFAVGNGYVTTAITDTGRGISPQDMPKLFQKFGRIANNYLIKQNVQGTGLGLYITKSIVELHGGRVWVASPGEGKGSTFSFSLKAAA